MATTTTTTTTADPAALRQRQIELLDAFDAGDYETVVSKWPPNDDDPSFLPRNVLWHALVETQRYDQAAAVVRMTQEQEEKTLYVDYKRGQYMSILKSYKSDASKSTKSMTNNLFGQVLYAQSLYHLGQYETAATTFFAVARHLCSNTNDDHDQNDDIAMKAWTNGISCWSADAAKTCLNATDETIVAEIMTFLNDNDHENNTYYELQYTLASFMLLVNQPAAAQWRNMLQSAQVACATDDDDDDEDLELIETNLSYVFGNKTWHDDNRTQTKNLVRLANTDPLAVSTPLPKEWTPRQRLTLVYNRALAKRQLQKQQDITKECQELKATTNKNSKNNYFWHIRGLLLENDTAAIEEFVKKNDETDPQSTLLATFHLAQFQDDPWTYLRTHLPPSVLATPAMQQYAILHSSILSDPSTTSTNNNLVEQYEANKNVDEASFARWVRALSMTDPDRALTEWRNHTNNTTAMSPQDDLDPVELEARRGSERRPRSLAAPPPPNNRAPTTTSTTPTTSNKNKKSHEAVLRYRAKKRAEYLARKNIPSHKTPSANRWTSQKQTAAQGAVSSNSAKYDVANRQVTANSTAHLGVKGGGGLNKKTGAGGKRR
jgi:hypothetical protein